MISKMTEDTLAPAARLDTARGYCCKDGGAVK